MVKRDKSDKEAPPKRRAQKVVEEEKNPDFKSCPDVTSDIDGHRPLFLALAQVPASAAV